jgi:hypothetical protein
MSKRLLSVLTVAALICAASAAGARAQSLKSEVAAVPAVTQAAGAGEGAPGLARI